MSEEEDEEDHGEETHAEAFLGPFEYNSEAFTEAMRLAAILLHEPVHWPPSNSAITLGGILRRRLLCSADAITLARLARAHRLSPPRLCLVVILLYCEYTHRTPCLNQVMIASAGFNLVETRRLHDWAFRSGVVEFFWDGNGAGVRLSRVLILQLLGMTSLTDEDEKRFRQALADLPVTLRDGIPDNRGTGESRD